MNDEQPGGETEPTLAQTIERRGDGRRRQADRAGRRQRAISSRGGGGEKILHRRSARMKIAPPISSAPMAKSRKKPKRALMSFSFALIPYCADQPRRR